MSRDARRTSLRIGIPLGFELLVLLTAASVAVAKMVFVDGKSSIGLSNSILLSGSTQIQIRGS